MTMTVQESKLNRLDTTRKMGGIIDRHWASLREAKANGEKVAWSVGPLFPYPFAVGMKSHMYAGYCAMVGGRHVARMAFEEAEARMGYMPESCSYHRAHMGTIGLQFSGQALPKELQLPIPDVILCGRGCTEHSHLTDSFHRYFKDVLGLDVPVIAVDMMPSQRERDIESHVKYVCKQIYEDVIPALETITGKKFDFDELSRIVAFLKATATMRNECAELMKRKPAPATIFDMSVSMAPTVYLLSPDVRKDALQYYVELKAEMEERIAKGITGIVPTEKYRVFYDGFMVWGWLGVLARKLAASGANAIIGRYAPLEMWPSPEEMDPEHPVEAIVGQLVRHMERNSGTHDGMKNILRWTEEYKIDAIIMHHARTCRLWNLPQNDTMMEAERKLGVPSILLEADMIDPKFWSEAQVDTRLQALFETVDARRAHR